MGTTNNTHIVMTAQACMPSKCWGRYAKVAVVKLEDGLPLDFRPAMISDRARGVVKVVELWDRCNVGKTDRCAFAVAKAAAENVCARLNAGLTDRPA